MNDQGTGTATWCSRCGATHLLADPCPTLQGRTGTVLGGKYLLARLIGEGGMGAVYEARHTVIGRRLAVKFLHGEFARRSDVAQRFENEARAAGEVEHENVAGSTTSERCRTERSTSSWSSSMGRISSTS